MTATEHAAASGATGQAASEDRTAATLRAERDFLLRSLADLDDERAVGELTEDRYRELHDRYTVQAATVLRALERLDLTSPASTLASPIRGRSPRLVAVVAVVAVLTAGGALLVNAANDRRPGETITGNAQSAASDLEALARDARRRPEDPGAQLAYASALMENDQLVDALKAFDAAARLDPADPVPKAYGGWIVFLAGLSDDALTRLDAAVAADPAYPDARFFRGMVLLRGRQDQVGALAELREYLRLAPTGPERDQVQALVDQLTTTATTSTTAPP